MADLYYIEQGYIEDSYFVYTADAAAVVTCEFTCTVAIGVIKPLAATLTSEFTQTCVISHIEGADIFAFSEAQLAVEVSRIRDINVSMSGVFSAAIDASRTRYLSSEEDAYFTVDIDILRYRNEEAALTTAFSLTCTPSELLPTASADLYSDTSLVMYPGFANKRPRSAVVSTGISLDYEVKKYGSASLKIVNSTTGLRISTTPGSNVALESGEFDIEFWANVSSVSGTANTYRTIARGYQWEIGFYWNASVVRSCYATYQSGGNTLTYLVPDPGLNAWYRWTLYKSGTNTVFTVGGNSDTTASLNIKAISTPDYIQLSMVNGTINIDEFYFARGISQPQYYLPSGEIDDGALPTTEALFHFNDLIIDTTTGIEPGNAYLPCEFTLTATSGKSISALANLTSQFTETVTATKIKIFDAALTSTSSITASINVTRQISTSLTSEFTEQVDFVRIKELSATLNSIASLTNQLNVIHDVSATLTALVSQLTANGRIRAEVADLDSNFALTASINVTRQSIAQLDATSNLTVAFVNYVGFSSNITTEFTQTVQAIKVIEFASDMTAFVTQLTANGRLRDEVAQLTSQFTLTGSLTQLGVVSADLSATFTESVTATRIKSATIDMTATVTQTVEVSKVLEAQADLAVIANQTVINERIRTNIVSVIAIATQLTANGRIRAEIADLDSEFTLTVTLSKYGTAEADLTANFTTSITVDKIRKTSAILNAQFNETVITKKISTAISTMQAITSLTASITTLRIDPDLLYVIPRETRLFTIPVDVKLWQVKQENRTFLIEDK